VQKLAIIGGGISGVSLAYLVQEQFDVTLFEGQDYLGGNNCSVEVEDGHKVPMGVIIYPSRGMFEHTLSYAEEFGLECKPAQLPHIFCNNRETRFHSSTGSGHFWRDMKDVAYLNFGMKSQVEQHDQTLDDLIAHSRLSRECIEDMLAPFAALYLSVPYSSIFELPLSTVAGWWSKYCHPFHLMSSFSYIDGGNHQLVDRFIERTQMTARLNSPVTTVLRDGDSLLVRLDQEEERFDKVVFATRPDEALALLDSPTKTEQRVLGQIDTNTLVSTLHRQPYDCEDGNITLNLYGDERSSTHMVTTWGNKKCFGFDLQEEVYTSLHQADKSPIASSDVLAQRTFKVPVQTANTESVADQIETLNAESDGIYYCGSWFCPSFYHEDGINSSIALGEMLRE
jgi:predicted NAD/FAD-binding protein